MGKTIGRKIGVTVGILGLVLILACLSNASAWKIIGGQNEKVATHFEEYKEAVIKESLRVLKTYGLRGFNESWSDGMDVFPVNSLLVLLGADVNYNEKTWDCNSNIFTELDILKDALSKHS